MCPSVPSEGDCDDGPVDAGEQCPLSRRGFLHVAGTALTLPAVPAAAEGSASPPAPSTLIRLTINGRRQSFEVDTRRSLLDLLRDDLALTGTKKGCNQGACGACTVLVDGQRVLSCLSLAALLDGATVMTIEGLADGERLHPLQAAFIEHDGLQCGFCTPGQIMSGIACIAEGHARSPEEVRFWMSGNVCRCGAYPGVVAAVVQVAGAGASS